MEKVKTSIIVKINDLEKAKNFYRILLNVGEAIMDSGFITVFETSENSQIILEKTEAKYLERDSSSTFWQMEVENIKEVQERLEKAKYKLQLEIVTHGTYVCYRTRDIEGNVFFIKENKKN